MNTLIIFTHPHRNSLNGAFLDSAIRGLKKNPAIQNIELLDLYEEEFDPLLRFSDTKRRRDMHKDPAFEPYREQIRRSDLMVFIYPIWWGRPPAMLLGYIDQLFASDFAYKNIEGKPMPDGLLKGKRVICIYTMKGPTAYPALLHRNAHKILMKRALFHFVGIRKVRFFEFGGMEKKGGRQDKNLLKIEKEMTSLKTGKIRKLGITSAP